MTQATPSHCALWLTGIESEDCTGIAAQWCGRPR
jgi:hypothetical protein